MNSAAQETENNISISDAVIRHDRLIRSIARRFVSARVDVDDLMQEGRIAFLGAAKSWRPEPGASLWTYARKAVFGAMFRLATSEIEQFASSDSDLYEHPDASDGPETFASKQEALALLGDNGGPLTPSQRALVRAYYIEGRSIRSIAASSHMAFESVRRALHDALHVMQVYLGVAQ